MTACDEMKLSLGAYALGVLDPDEEREIREHLERCPSCADEAAELSGTVSLLALLRQTELADMLTDPSRSAAPDARAAGPSASADETSHARALSARDSASSRSGGLATKPGDDLLSRILERVTAERRRRRWTSALSVAAAVVVLVAGAVAIGTGRLNEAPEARPAPTTAASPTTGAPLAVLTASDPVTGATLRLETTPKGWGTALHLELGGVPGGLRCSLVAIGPGGAREVAASWTVPEGGYGGPGSTGRLVVDGAVGFRPDEVSSYEVVTTDGRTLLSVPA